MKQILWCKIRSAGAFFAPVIFCLFLIHPAHADSVCTNGSLAALIGTTCDLGSLQFTFTSWLVDVNSYNATTGRFADNTSSDASNLTFTALSNGFSLSGNESLTGLGFNTDVVMDGELTYSVVDLSGQITGVNLATSGLSVSGTADSVAESYEFTIPDPAGSGIQLPTYYWIYELGGVVSAPQFEESAFAATPFSSASTNLAHPFYFFVQNNDNASWDGSTNFTFDTTAVPEPSPSLVLILGLAALTIVRPLRK